MPSIHPRSRMPSREHREHTIDPLLLLHLLHRLLLFLPLPSTSSPSSTFSFWSSSSLSLSSFSYSTLKCGWFVCTRHKACLAAFFRSPPLLLFVVLLILLLLALHLFPRESVYFYMPFHTFSKGIRELILI